MLFVIYLALLTWIVLWKLEIPYLGWSGMRHIKLVPFAPTARAGASEPIEVAVNVLLFVPFGLYLTLLAPSWPWRKAAWAVAGASLTLEVAQYALAVGSSDFSDVLANTAGGLMGIGLLTLARRKLPGRTVRVMRLVCSAGTALALLAAIGVVVASPLRFGPPGDVPGMRTDPGPGAPGAANGAPGVATARPTAGRPDR